LGNNSLMSNASGQMVESSDGRYPPYGRWRTEPTANLTDRGHTGHKHNDNLGGTAVAQARGMLRLPS
jgi:hypothetical protein